VRREGMRPRLSGRGALELQIHWRGQAWRLDRLMARICAAVSSFAATTRFQGCEPSADPAQSLWTGGPRRLAHLQQRASLAAQCRAFAGL